VNRAVRGDDAGVTLVELILTVAIMGIAIVTIVGGAMTSILDSDYNHKQADAANVLQAYADSVAALVYQPCSAAYAPAYTPPTGYTVAIAGTEYWDTATSAFISTCPASDYGLERLTLQVSSTDSRANETLQVEKRIAVTGQTP
jgi:type II secretory pathway pseudopilin PulG